MAAIPAGRAMASNGTVQKTKPRIERNRVLVTGGAGFVGSHLCTYLVERGDHVRASSPIFLCYWRFIRPKPRRLTLQATHCATF